MMYQCIIRVHTQPGKPGNPGKEPILGKSQGKPGKVREKKIFFIAVREKSGKFIHALSLLFNVNVTEWEVTDMFYNYFVSSIFLVFTPIVISLSLIFVTFAQGKIASFTSLVREKSEGI